ncbi:MAG: cytochrome P450 [Rhodospirillaceae bacterium]
MQARKELAGPKGYPIVGVLPMLRGNTFKFLVETARDFGDIVPLRILMTTAYLLNHPAHVEHVLQKNYRNYRKTPMLGKLRPVLGDGLFMSEGELWTRQRKLIQPSFHKERVDALASRMTDVIQSHLKTWETRAHSGEVFNISDDTSILTLEIALQTMFSTGLGGDANGFAEAMKIVHEVSSKRIWDITGLGEMMPTKKNRDFKTAVDFLQGVVSRIIEERRAKPSVRDDLLSILMDARDADTNEAMSDRQLRDEVMTLMLAGHDTTATMVAWALLMLTQHPAHLERMRDEADMVLAGRIPEAGDVKTLDYTKRVIQEVARLRPSFWWFARVAINDDNIAGQPIKAGTTVFISQYLIHTLPNVWEDPEKFDPDRFLPDQISGRSKFAYFPFGAGPRVCIGSGFAMMEMQFALAMIFRRFDLEITSEKEPEFGNLITLRPTNDIFARAKLRLRH